MLQTIKTRKVVSKMGTGRRYGEEFKKEAVKLAKEIGSDVVQ